MIIRHAFIYGQILVWPVLISLILADALLISIASMPGRWPWFRALQLIRLGFRRLPDLRAWPHRCLHIGHPSNMSSKSLYF